LVFDQPDAKEIYAQYTDSQKKYIWMLKISNVLANTFLSIEQFYVINNVKMALGQQNDLKLNRQVRDAVIEVTKIVHQDDLIEIFTTLRKFDVNKYFRKSVIVCERCIEEF
jgi:hypothetical protein